MFNITNIENENELANTSTSLKSSSPKSDGDLHILLLDSKAARDASPQELSDDEDNEITQTRSMSRRIIRAVAVNSNTGRISTIDPQDIPVIGKLKLFGFIPDETPLISTTLCNDDDRPKLCEIGFFDIEKTKCSLKLTSETAEDIFKRIPEEELYNSKPHCIVAITRHRKTFKYFSPVANDTLSEWVKQMNSYSDNDLAKHLRAESHIVPHTQADEHIPLSQSLTLQTHSASTLENTEKGNNTPLPITQENSTMTHHTLLTPITVGEDHQETQDNGHETKLTNNTSSYQYYHTEKLLF
ncbi:hypothetical protein J6590_041615 [Homalodisca vitripennis]|nr:hypothetical protein J6590_041615 [Homalodisca vitripennis]